MQISNAIAQLQEIHRTHGDIELGIHNDGHEWYGTEALNDDAIRVLTVNETPVCVVDFEKTHLLP